MTLAEEIADAAAEALGPIAQNAVATAVKGVTDAIAANKNDLLARLSGKEIQLTIKLPDLTK
jgi:hypothetical protein